MKLKKQPAPPVANPIPAPETRGPGFLVRRLQQVSVSIFHEHLEPLGLTPLQATVLRILGKEDGLDQISLANRAMVDPSTTKDVVHRLEANKAVVRVRSEIDRRMQLVYLTARGRQLLRDSTPAALQAAQRLLSPLTAEEQRSLLAAIRKLVAAHEEPTMPGRRAPWRRGRCAK